MVKSSKLNTDDSEHISVNFNHFDDVVRIHTYSNLCQHVVNFEITTLWCCIESEFMLRCCVERTRNYKFYLKFKFLTVRMSRTSRMSRMSRTSHICMSSDASHTLRRGVLYFVAYLTAPKNSYPRYYYTYIYFLIP